MTINALTGNPDPSQQDAQAVPLEPVYGDVLPPIGSRVFIRHGRDDDAHACTVTGYYAWGDLGGNKNLHRVFVRMVYEGTDTRQARLLRDCYQTAEAALNATPTPPAQQAPLEGGPPGSGGWKAYAGEVEKERDYWRQRAQTMFEHQRGEVWYWQGDGNDHLESMCNSLPVVIRADALRELLAAPTPPAQRRAPIDWSQAGALMEAAASAKSAGFTTGTTNWAAHICRHMEAISARQKPSWGRLPADDTEGGAA